MQITINSVVNMWKGDTLRVMLDKEHMVGFLLYTIFWHFVMYKFLLQVKKLTFFRLTKLLMIKPLCYKMPFRAFLIHYLSAYLEMYRYVLLSKYLMRLVLNFKTSGILVVCFLLLWHSLHLLINK